MNYNNHTSPIALAGGGQDTASNYQYKMDGAHKTATLMLKSFFNPKNILINTPVFLVSQGGKQVTVQLSYFIAPANLEPKGRLHPFSNGMLKTLMTALSLPYGQVYKNGFGKGQETTVQLELVRQHRPYMDAAILSQYLAINLSTQGFSRVTNLLLNAVPYLNPSYAFNLSCITGVKVQLSGLLTSQRNRSRKSVYTASAGTFHSSAIPSYVDSKGNVALNEQDYTNSLVSPITGKGGGQVDYSSYTSKSGLGAFTVKV
jgi:hypothetical protein